MTSLRQRGSLVCCCRTLCEDARIRAAKSSFLDAAIDLNNLGRPHSSLNHTSVWKISKLPTVVWKDFRALESNDDFVPCLFAIKNDRHWCSLVNEQLDLGEIIF